MLVQCHSSLRAALAAVVEQEAQSRERWWDQYLADRELGNASLLLMIRGHVIKCWLMVCLCLLVSLKGCNCILLLMIPT